MTTEATRTWAQGFVSTELVRRGRAPAATI